MKTTSIPSLKEFGFGALIFIAAFTLAYTAGHAFGKGMAEGAKSVLLKTEAAK